jgi:collagen beta-1,O-galactosyltransferase
MTATRQVTPIAVACLRRRSDRREAITSNLRSVSVTDALFADDIGASVDWRDWNYYEIARLAQSVFPWRVVESDNSWWGRDVKLGEIACALTHWRLWTYGHTRQFANLIILEDDAECLPEFVRRDDGLAALSQADPNWDLLYLGRERLESDRGTIGAFAVPGFSYCTYGYALSARGIEKLLSTDLPNSIIPIDEFLPAMYMPHPRPDVRARFPAGIAAYGLLQDVVTVRSEDQWGSDTETSPLLTTK